MASRTSRLIDEKKQRLCALLGDVELTLLYKASVHGYDAPAFHQRCDRQGPTLLVSYNNSGYVFGGYTSADYTQSRQYITDDKAFLFNVPKHGGNPITIKVNSGGYAHLDDSGVPNFGQQLFFCYNNRPCLSANSQMGLGSNTYCNTNMYNTFKFNAKTLYGNDTQLAECEVYKVTQIVSRVSADQVKEKQWRNVRWTVEQIQELLKSIKDYKPLESSVNRVQILMIGPVGAGKSSFFNSIISIFMGRMTNKAMAGSSGTSLTTHFRTYPVKDGREGKPLPFVLCDTMGLEEQSGAGLDIEDISSILQGLIPDRYMFNPMAPFHPNEQNAFRSLKERIHCVVYIMDTTKVSLMSSKLEEKLVAIRKKVNSLGKCSQNYSQELELNLSCDVLLLTALQQMLRFADDYFDDVGAIE